MPYDDHCHITLCLSYYYYFFYKIFFIRHCLITLWLVLVLFILLITKHFVESLCTIVVDLSSSLPL